MPTLSPIQLWQNQNKTTDMVPMQQPGTTPRYGDVPAGMVKLQNGTLVPQAQWNQSQAGTVPALGQQQTATIGTSYTPALTSTGAAPWWMTPESATQGMATFGNSFPQAAGTDPAALNAIQVKQAQDMLAQIQANFDKQRSSTAGYLGGANMQNSGLGAHTLALADNEQARQQMAAANQLAAILAQANLENNRFNAQYNLDRSGQISNTALGFAQLGANTQNQQADLALRQQQVTNQNQQFYAGQQFAADQADLARAHELGVLAAQQAFQGGQSQLQRQHEIEIQQIAAHNQQAAQEIDNQFKMGFLQAQQQFQGGQAALDRQQQTGVLGMQQQFQGQQSALDRAQQAQLAHDQLSQQLQITMAQLANAAADRTQQGQLETQRLQLQAQQIQAAIEQNKASNQLQGRQLDNQYALGMADVGIRGAQLGMQQQGQQVQNALAVGTAIRQGLNPQSDIGQSIMGMAGLGQQPQLDRNGRPTPPAIQRQPMTFEQFAQAQGVPSSWSTGSHPYGSAEWQNIQRLQNEYMAYQQKTQPQQAYGLGVPTYGDLAQMQQVGNQTRQLDLAAQNQAFEQQMMAQRLNNGTIPIGDATKRSVVSHLPNAAQSVYSAVLNGTTPNIGHADMNYWLGNLGKQGILTPDQIANFKLNIRSKV